VFLEQIQAFAKELSVDLLHRFLKSWVNGFANNLEVINHREARIDVSNFLWA
jgi:hypothetical protein